VTVTLIFNVPGEKKRPGQRGIFLEPECFGG